MAKAGRPEILNEQKQETLCALIAVGVSRRQAALQIGCCPSTVNKRFACDRNFRQRLQAAEGKRRVHALESLGQHSQRSWRAAVWILENTCPEFAKKTRRDELMIQRVFDGVVDAVFDVVRDDRMRDEILERLKHLPLDEFHDDATAEHTQPRRPVHPSNRPGAPRHMQELDEYEDEYEDEYDGEVLEDEESDEEQADEEQDDDETGDEELDDELDAEDRHEDQQEEVGRDVALGHDADGVGETSAQQVAASEQDEGRPATEPDPSSPPAGTDDDPLAAKLAPPPSSDKAQYSTPCGPFLPSGYKPPPRYQPPRDGVFHQKYPHTLR